MRKKSKKVLGIISIILIVIVGAGLFYFFGASYPRYSSISAEEFAIIGLEDGFTPQGIAYDKNNDKFLISGYMNDERLASRIYIVDEQVKEEKYVMLNTDGETYFGHAGGIAVYGGYVYVAGEGIVREISLVDIYSANSGDKVEVLYSFEAGNGADCLTVYGNELWVGEFYKKGKYETHESHHLTNSFGEKTMAVSFAFELDASGVVSDVPVKGLATPNQLQGLEFFNGDNLMISTSYGLPDSKLYVYTDVFEGQAEHQVEVSGATVPVYTLSSSKCEMEITAPCMSEEIVLAGDKIYILYESACNKYKFFTRTRTKNVHSIEVEKLLNAGE